MELLFGIIGLFAFLILTLFLRMQCVQNSRDRSDPIRYRIYCCLDLMTAGCAVVLLVSFVYLLASSRNENDDLPPPTSRVQ